MCTCSEPRWNEWNGGEGIEAKIIGPPAPPPALLVPAGVAPLPGAAPPSS